MDSRLQRAISTPKILQQAGELIRLCFRALDDLKQLDESLYERFLQTRQAPENPVAYAAGLHRLWDDTFRGLFEVLAFCRTLTAGEDKSNASSDDSAAFDFGDFGESGPPAQPDLSIGAAEIGDLLENLDDVSSKDDSERWQGVVDKVSSIEYGLTSQLKDARERFEVAIRAGERNHVLGIVDDTQSSSSEGVHALVAAVYETFVPDVAPATVVPGYLTSLGRALLVRRGLADLASKLTGYNDTLQNDREADEHAHALAQVRSQMRTFVNSVVCRAMRAADRWQMVEFERELSEQPLRSARQTSEGLVKYVDSLSSINQREVLQLHDSRVIAEMREALSSARQLLDLSQTAAREQMDRAYQAANRLKGRSPVTDELLVGLERFSPNSSRPGENAAYLEKLEQMLAAADR